VAPIYAGILGLLALLTSLAHGMIHAADCEAMLFGAWCSLLVFSALGYVIGSIAGRTVEESVNASIKAEVEAARTTDDRTSA